jgi:hypothetical protein
VSFKVSNDIRRIVPLPGRSVFDGQGFSQLAHRLEKRGKQLVEIGNEFRPAPLYFKPAVGHLSVVDVEHSHVPILDDLVPGFHDPAVVSQVIHETDPVGADALVEKPALLIRCAFYEIDIVMAEDDAGYLVGQFLTVLNRRSVQTDFFFPFCIAHTDFGIYRRAGISPLPPDRHFPASMPEHHFVAIAPEASAVGQKIQGFEKIGFPLAVGTYKKYLLVMNRYFLLADIAEIDQADFRKRHPLPGAPNR